MPDIRIRCFRTADAPALRRVFHSSVHGLAGADYSEAQRRAWAPDEYDEAQWSALLQRLQPFVVELIGAPAANLAGHADLAGYADLQADGYIDHFFVAGHAGRRGIGSRLMRHLIDTAEARGIESMHANVSLTAQPLFERFGFVVVQPQTVLTRGVEMRNTRMRRGGAADAQAS